MNRSLFVFLAAQTGWSAPELQRILEPHYKPLGAFLRLKGCPETEVEDLLQETFLAFLASPRGEEDFPSPGKLRNFLLTIAMNKLRDFFRKRGTAGRHRLTFNSSDDLSAALDRVESSLPGPEEALVTQEDQRLTAACVVWTLETLPDRYRQVLTLRFQEGLEAPELAARLGLGIKGVESLLLRARGRFRKEFETHLKQAKDLRPARVYNKKEHP